ncbi:hypothetical protein TNIN_321141 [Trichonephila inaurata madagascariensis]|uniref:Uncharacterized protein n=1 Tax=Trichonephila inaurata madagascariensis TaxID=2747483 RepID=A0A8X6ILC6_9ARAC|nr:hypothetical protein TNIN_321141 [Trichonephila inaurata madagascariensis]
MGSNQKKPTKIPLSLSFIDKTAERAKKPSKSANRGKMSYLYNNIYIQFIRRGQQHRTRIPEDEKGHYTPPLPAFDLSRLDDGERMTGQAKGRIQFYNGNPFFSIISGIPVRD